MTQCKTDIGYQKDVVTKEEHITNLVNELKKDKLDYILNMNPVNCEIEIDLDKSQVYREIFVAYKEDFKALVKASVFGILTDNKKQIFVEDVYSDLRVKIIERPDIKLNQIGPKHYNKPVTFDCVITAADVRKLYVIKAIFECPVCGDFNEVSMIEQKHVKPMTCGATKACKDTLMILNEDKISLDYIQSIRIEEPTDEAIENTPLSFVARIKGTNVGEAYSGQKKRVTGVFRMDFDYKKKMQNIYIDVIDLRDIEDKRIPRLTDEEMQALSEDVKKAGFLDRVAGSFCTQIEGNTDVKKSIILQLIGGDSPDCVDKRNYINVFLTGDPGTAKSEMLKEAHNLMPKSIYATGKGVSGCGLTITMIKDEEIGGWVPRAGVYPLCNGGFAMIDEFDKMSNEDRSTMHEVMEQGTASSAKGGRVLTVDAKTATLAAANPKYGKYDESLDVLDNVNLPQPILSRFDIIWLIRDIVDVDKDTKIADRIMKVFKDENDKPCFTKEELTKYIHHVRNMRPVLSDEASKKLKEIYLNMRQASKKNKTTPIGTRQLESLIRFSIAHAKAHLKDVVDLEDVAEVKRLYYKAFESFGAIITGDAIQLTLAQDEKKKLNKDHTFIQCFRELEKQSEDGLVSKTDLIQKLIDDHGWEETKALQTFNNWKSSSHILERFIGRYEMLQL